MSSNPNPESNNAEQNAEQTETMDVQTAQRVEQEKMTRRAALRKLGFGAGFAAFSLLGADDLARIVGKRLERMAGDNKIAEQIAREFQGAGIAMAASPSGGGLTGGSGCGCLPACGCGGCPNSYELHMCGCDNAFNQCVGPTPSGCGNGNGIFNLTCIRYNWNLNYNCYPERNTCYNALPNPNA